MPTLIAWMKIPEFDQAYPGGAPGCVPTIGRGLQQASGAAATTLLKIMIDGSGPASTRLRAADIVRRAISVNRKRSGFENSRQAPPHSIVERCTFA